MTYIFSFQAETSFSLILSGEITNRGYGGQKCNKQYGLLEKKLLQAYLDNTISLSTIHDAILILVDVIE